MCILNIIVILFALLYRSLGIGVEYYVDQDETTAILYTPNDSAARRNLKRYSTSQSNFSISRALYDFEEDNIILSYNIAKPKQFLKNTLIEKNKSTTHQNVSGSNRLTVKPSQDVNYTPFSLRLNSFEEYDYIYKFEVDDLQSLRQKTTAGQSTESLNKTESDISYGKFFNLEPAVDQNVRYEQSKELFNKTWYVTQDFPCWDLPVLYGELGIKKKKSNVFVIHGGNLVNVIEPLIEIKESLKPEEPPISHIINKWCEVEPCYGDHTLCLFPNAEISNMCDKQYKVHVPTIVEQFALINTINTMRNHVANGVSKNYPHLPTAANMKQITYDYDLEDMAHAWLLQCLPGSAPCSALDGNIVSHLECTKYAKFCCSKTTKRVSECVPRPGCYVYPIIGCLHVWFSSAGKELIETDIQCGRSSVSTFNTVQLLWAKTSKIGCAFGERANGDIRVVCNFSPGAPFYLDTKLYCGIIAHKDIKSLRNNENITNLIYLASLGIKWHSILKFSDINTSTQQSGSTTIATRKSTTTEKSKPNWGVESLLKLYKEGWARKQLSDRTNGTKSMTARLVAKYTFVDESESRCDSDESVYVAGSPGSMCVEKGRIYHGLCYDFRDPTPGYRFIAIAAPIALFSLILYDLFSGVVRQTNH